MSELPVILVAKAIDLPSGDHVGECTPPKLSTRERARKSSSVTAWIARSLPDPATKRSWLPSGDHMGGKSRYSPCVMAWGAPPITSTTYRFALFSPILETKAKWRPSGDQVRNEFLPNSCVTCRALCPEM